MIFRDDRSFIYALPDPVLPSDASPIREKEWGEPPSSDEVFSTMDLDEFVGTDFSCLRFFVPPDRHLEVNAASQYDPYADVHLSGMQSIPRVPFNFLDSVPREAGGTTSLGPSVIPGFAPEVSSTTNSDAELYGEHHPRPTTGPRFEQDHSSGSSSNADFYGSMPHNASLPRGSDRPKSSHVDAHYTREQIRKFDTSTLLHVIPEVCLHSTIYVQWLQTKINDSLASFPSCKFCECFCRSPLAHSTFQQKYSRSDLPEYRHKRRDLPPIPPWSRLVDYSSTWDVAVGWVHKGTCSPTKPLS